MKHYFNENQEFLMEFENDEKTPAVWSHILANENFGTLVTESGGGYTWSGNSRDNKLTNWSNDFALDPPSEEILVDGVSIFSGKRKISYKFGKIEIEKDGLSGSIFVPIDQNVKVTKINLEKEMPITYNLKTVLGVFEHETRLFIKYEKINDYCAKIYNSFSKEKAEMFIESDSAIKNIIQNKNNFIIEYNAKNIILKMSSKPIGADLKPQDDYWQNMFSKLDTSKNPKIKWLFYQTLVCRLWARTAFFQCGGAIGFRDQLQDSLAMLNIIDEIPRNQILLACQHQYEEGDVQHWFFPIGKGVRTRFSDDLLWLPYAVCEYIEKTNDKSILEVVVPFLKSEILKPDEHERYEQAEIGETATVKEHCLRAINYSFKLGEHNLPLIGIGDWNDGFSNVGKLGKGESVWLAWFMIDVMQKWNKTINDMFGDRIKILKAAANSHGWDGEWFKRAFYDDGSPMGSKTCKECKIDAIAQSWAVICNGSSKEKCAMAMQSVMKHLVDKENGIVKLLTPPFKLKDPMQSNPGYISSYLPGIRENGAQYTHGAAWVIIALKMLGKTAEAEEILEMILPWNKANIENYSSEPYVAAADVYANSRGGWTWYTGSSGWLIKAINM